MARWAVFDVDGTLLPEISMEREFLNYLIRKRLLRLKNLLNYLFKGLIFALALRWEEAVKSNKTYLKGLSVSIVDEYAAECFHKRIAPALTHNGKQKVEAFRLEGYKILIISGAPSFLASHLQPVYHPDHIVCTELEVKNGGYSGEISGLHPFGKRKQIILENIKNKLDIDFDNSVVFADHHADVYHMRLFGKAVAVNATHKLKKAAFKYGWEIEVWG